MVATVHSISPNNARAYKPVDHRRKLTDEQIAKAVEMRLAGHTFKKIAAAVGVTTPAVFDAIRKKLDPESHRAWREKANQRENARKAAMSPAGRKTKEIRSGERQPDPSAKARANREYMKRRRDARRSVIEKIKSAPCTDCKNTFHPVAMQFDHRTGTQKLFNIGERYASVPEDVLMEEIAKCDLVCANCHAVRTHTGRL